MIQATQIQTVSVFTGLPFTTGSVGIGGATGRIDTGPILTNITWTGGCTTTARIIDTTGLNHTGTVNTLTIGITGTIRIGLATGRADTFTTGTDASIGTELPGTTALAITSGLRLIIATPAKTNTSCRPSAIGIAVTLGLGSRRATGIIITLTTWIIGRTTWNLASPTIGATLTEWGFGQSDITIFFTARHTFTGQTDITLTVGGTISTFGSFTLVSSGITDFTQRVTKAGIFFTTSGHTTTIGTNTAIGTPAGWIKGITGRGLTGVTFLIVNLTSLAFGTTATRRIGTTPWDLTGETTFAIRGRRITAHFRFGGTS